MSPKTHAKILTTHMTIAIGLWLIFILYSCGSSSDLDLPTVCPAFGAFIVVWLGILFLAPLQCSKNGCYGRVKRHWISQPNFQLRLQYKCEGCDEIVDTNITIGLGEPY